MRTIFNLFRYFFLYSKLKLAKGMQYKTDFFMGIFLALLFSSMSPIFQYLIFSQTNGYPRWNIKQFILFQGVMLIWLGIKDILFGDIRPYVENMVKNGNFDRLILKPYPSIGIILTSGFYYQGLGTIISGLIILIISIYNLGLVIKWWQICIFIGFMLCGILLYMSVIILYCIIIIMITFMGRLGEIIDKFLQFSQFPLDIMTPVLKISMMIFLPIAVWVYFPTEALLNRLDFKAFISIGVCVILFFISIKLWNISLKKYTSAGG